MKCDKCGYLNNDSDKFCGMCGAPMPTPSQKESETPAPDFSFDADFEEQYPQQDYSQQDLPQQDFSSQQSYQQDFSQQGYQQDFSQQGYQQYKTFTAASNTSTQQATADPGQTLGIVSLVTSVLSILTSCCSSFILPFLSALSLPFAIAALVCGAMGMKKSKEVGKTNAMAIIGLIIGVLSILAVLVTVVLSVLGLVGMGAAMMYEEFF